MGRKSDSSSKLKNKPLEAGDEQIGEWPRDRLVRMDTRFVDAVEDRTGQGAHPQSAARAGTVRPSVLAA